MLRRPINTLFPAALVFLLPAYAQTADKPQKTLERRTVEMTAPVANAPVAKAPAPKPKAAEPRADYILGPDDQIALLAPDAEEVNGKAFRIEGNGSLTVPLIGSLQAAGLTTSQLSAEIAKRLEKYYLKPHVVVSVTEYRSQPVSVIGAVNTPGVHQVQGRKTLVEMISMAGGPREDAGPKIVLTRRAEWGMIPVEGAVTDSSGEFSTVEIDLKAVVTAARPQDNVAVKPNDVIAVQKARVVYVVGEVHHPGGFVLTHRDGMSALQALSMDGGLKATAKAGAAAIIHKDEANPTERTKVNLTHVLEGKVNDVEMLPDDILYVPDSRPKKAAYRAAEAAVQALTGVVIWRAGDR